MPARRASARKARFVGLIGTPSCRDPRGHGVSEAVTGSRQRPGRGGAPGPGATRDRSEKGTCSRHAGGTRSGRAAAPGTSRGCGFRLVRRALGRPRAERTPGFAPVPIRRRRSPPPATAEGRTAGAAAGQKGGPIGVSMGRFEARRALGGRPGAPGRC
jgi:hypothetical protein